MGEKDEKVTSIKKRKEIVGITDKYELTSAELAEIAEQMRKDEEEIDRHLSKFASIMPANTDSSSVIEEDEEDEEFVVDIEKGLVTQVEELILIREGESNEPMMIKADAGMPYGDFIRDLFVRKAIAKLLKDTRDQWDEVYTQQENMPSYLADTLNQTIVDIEKRRNELAKSIRGNKVHYDDIPEWATTHINDYVENILTNLISLGEDW